MLLIFENYFCLSLISLPIECTGCCYDITDNVSIEFLPFYQSKHQISFTV